MNTSLTHLPPAKQEQLLAITQLIAKTVRPEKLILFGIHAAGSGIPDWQADDSLPPFIFSYDILVVTRRGDRRYDHEVQDIVENRCRFQTPVTVLVHDIDYVNQRLSEGHYFFSMIRKEAVLLYDAGS